MRKKPTYQYPKFIRNISMNATRTKRYYLSLDLDNAHNEHLLVILKNPSRANDQVSDKTVFNVSNYVFKNSNNHKALKDIGRLTILNLMPHYLTDSRLLHTKKRSLIDPKNFETIDTLCRQTKRVIIAWGNAPKGLEDTYDILKTKVMALLDQHHNQVYYVKQLSKAGNPRHGQVWGYKDPLIRLKL